jgi:formylglycine-generating enzyme
VKEFVFDGRNFTETASNLYLEMIAVKGGTFTMGCTSEQGSDCCDSDEIPAHQVTVSDYYIGKYEVTQRQWRAVMGNNPSRFSGCDNCPVEQVSWNDVQEFIRKLNQLTGKNYRLPTEAQWEFAARGGASGSPTKYAGSNTIGDVAWYDGNSGSKTHPVGQKRPNELGIYDMSGNVWEWCNDWYGSYTSGTKSHPSDSASGSRRVRRGGSWDRNARYCRVSFRSLSTPDNRFNYLGFRLVLVP